MDVVEVLLGVVRAVVMGMVTGMRVAAVPTFLIYPGVSRKFMQTIGLLNFVLNKKKEKC